MSISNNLLFIFDDELTWELEADFRSGIDPIGHSSAQSISPSQLEPRPLIASTQMFMPSQSTEQDSAWMMQETHVTAKIDKWCISTATNKRYNMGSLKIVAKKYKSIKIRDIYKFHWFRIIEIDFTYPSMRFFKVIRVLVY